MKRMRRDSEPSQGRARLTRRAFVFAAGVVVGVFASRPGRARASGAAETPGAATSATPGQAGRASNRDITTLVALGFALIPSSMSRAGVDGNEDGPSAAAEQVLRDRLKEMADSGAAARADMRQAAALLDEESQRAHGTPFAALDAQRRERLLASVLEPFTQRTLPTALYYYVTERGRQIRRLWGGVSKPLLVAFHESDLGWQMVGQVGRPGTCSDLVGYQSPPGPGAGAP